MYSRGRHPPSAASRRCSSGVNRRLRRSLIAASRSASLPGVDNTVARCAWYPAMRAFHAASSRSTSASRFAASGEVAAARMRYTSSSLPPCARSCCAASSRCTTASGASRSARALAGRRASSAARRSRRCCASSAGSCSIAMRASAADASASCGPNSACDSASVKWVARKASIVRRPSRRMSTLRPMGLLGRCALSAVLNCT